MAQNLAEASFGPAWAVSERALCAAIAAILLQCRADGTPHVTVASWKGAAGEACKATDVEAPQLAAHLEGCAKAGSGD